MDNPITATTTDLPPVTPALVQRVTTSVAAARNIHVRHATEFALNQIEQVAQGRLTHRINANLRQQALLILLPLVMQVRYEGIVHIPRGPVIYAPNHLSHFDPFMVVAALPTTPYCSLVGDNRAMFNIWWKRALVRTIGGVIPLSRRWKEERAVLSAYQQGNAALAELAAAIEQDVPETAPFSELRRLDSIMTGVLQRGESLIVFPEGRLSNEEGQLHLPLKDGVVRYALRTKVPIVPIGITGSAHLYLRKLVTLRFGPPVQLPHVPHPRTADIATANIALTTAMQALLSPDYREPQVPHIGAAILQHIFR